MFEIHWAVFVRRDGEEFCPSLTFFNHLSMLTDIQLVTPISKMILGMFMERVNTFVFSLLHPLVEWDIEQNEDQVILSQRSC